MVAAIAAAINGLLSAIGHAKSMAGSVLGGVGKLVSSQSALPGLGYAASVPVPALANGAVIPPNKKFKALLGDQTTGTNVEAPLATIKQAMAETLAGWQGSADGQPINIYIGEELLDKVFRNFALKLLSAVIGAIIYYVVITGVLRLGLESTDLKLRSALVGAVFLAVPYWKGRYFTKPVRKEGAPHA